MDRWQVKCFPDTHTLVWAIDDPAKLSGKARAAIESGDVVISVVTLWELILKRSTKGALLVEPFSWWEENVAGSHLTVLGIHQSHILALRRLQEIHRDPFDRMLIAQCKVEGGILISRDRSLAGYGVPVLW